MEGLSGNVEAYVSPTHHPFQTLVPIFRWVGASEALSEDIKTFEGEMARTRCNRVRFRAQDKATQELLINLRSVDGVHALMGQACKFLNHAE